MPFSHGSVYYVGHSVIHFYIKQQSKMYQITKEDLKTRQRILLIDSHSEVLEFETLREAEELVNIMNANASGYRYGYRKVGSVKK